MMIRGSGLAWWIGWVAIAASACVSRRAAEPVQAAHAALAGDPWTLAVSGGSQPEGTAFDSLGVYDAARKEYVYLGSGSITWTWNGTRWKHYTGPTPINRQKAAAVYDPVRQVVVLYGGHDPSFLTAYDDLWEWDGTQWSERCGVGCAIDRPEARIYHALAARNGQVYLLGGTNLSAQPLTTVWAWNGTQWAQQAWSMPARAGHTVTLDPDTNDFIVYGGRTPGDPNFNSAQDTLRVALDGAITLYTTSLTAWNSGSAYYDVPHARVRMLANFPPNIYEFTGIDWALVPTTGPRPDNGSANNVAFDFDRNRVVVGSGTAGSGIDAFELANNVWVRRASATPLLSGRQGAAMAYDLARQRMVLFGGGTFDPQSGVWSNQLGDTWEWDGNEWRRVLTVLAPTPRAGAFMVYHIARQAMLLVGGDDGAGGGSEMWQWDGTTWTLLPQTWTAGGLLGVTYDRDHDQVVAINDAPAIFTWDETNWNYVADIEVYNSLVLRMAPNPGGGLLLLSESSLPGETIVWDGVSGLAVNQFPAHSPPSRFRAGLAFDPRSQRTMLVGGRDGAGSYSTDTWAWNGVDWVQTEDFAGEGREWPAFVFDEDRGNGLLVGGGRPGLPGFITVYPETWRYAVVGVGCTVDAECTSGFCADGVCCDRACAGGCEVCTVAKGATTDGVCKVLDEAQALRGDCGDLLCRGAVSCPASCFFDQQCGSTNPYCCQPLESGECTVNQCTNKKHDGIACSAGSECLSGACTNGVCCEAACGTCARCDTPGFLGQCHAVAEGQSEPATCASPKICDATQHCGLENGTVATVAGDCLSGKIADGVCCDTDCTGDCQTCATGTCALRDAGDAGRTNACLDRVVAGVPKPTSCDGTNPSCRASCAADNECITGYICCTSTTAGCTAEQVGTCTPKVALGGSCDEDADCVSGHCADGVCCNTACDGHVCLGCNLTGSVGVCSVRSGAFAGCTGEGACTGECVGTVTAPACIYAGPDRKCGLCVVCDGRGGCNALPPTGIDTDCPMSEPDCTGFGECVVATATATQACEAPRACGRASTARDCALSPAPDGTACTGGTCQSGTCRVTTTTNVGSGCAITRGDGDAPSVLLAMLMLWSALALRRRARWSASRSCARRFEGEDRD